ncbi:hypothetical protein SSX86_006117 [Deinandra increscens subsp. villosa]|uniref:Ribosomal protein S11 n=1 Tax=Deinandra increscens subsp. villosa TaxID=3103831 RepID=A0AAP0DMU9_9ASTR
MVLHQIISRLPGRSKIFDQSLKPLSQIGQKRDLFSGISESYRAPTLSGNLGMKLGFAQEKSLSGSLKFANSIHSLGPKGFERGMDNWQPEREKNPGYVEGSNTKLNDIDEMQPPIKPGLNTGFIESLTRRFADMDVTRAPPERGQDGRPFARGLSPFESGRNMSFVRGIMKDNENYRSGVEQNADIVHIKIMRNNTFVTVTDSQGNKKMGASAGCLAEMKGGPKVSKYSAEATAEHVGRLAKSMGLKSVVMKVNGFTFFKKKKLAILSFRDGYTNSRSDKNPIVYIEDTTRKPHNGCRRKKQRRV